MKKYSTILLLIFLSHFVFAQNFNWNWQNPKPHGNTLNSVSATPIGYIFMFGEVGHGLASTNGGVSWISVVTDTAQKRTVESGKFINTFVGYLCGDLGMIEKTTNGGASGFSLNSGTTEHLYDIDFLDTDTGYAVGSAGIILKTTNGGSTWVVKSSPLTANIYAVHVLNASTIFLGASSSNPSHYICRSTDYGNTWTNISPVSFNKTVWDVYFSDANKGWFSAQDGGKIYYTTDGGINWGSSVTNSLIVPNSLFFSDANTGYVTNNNNGKVHRTTDGGLTWNEYTAGKFSLYSISKSGLALYGAGKYGSAYKSTDAGLTWTPIHNAITQETIRKIYFTNENNGYCVGGSTTTSDSLGIILKTTDAGSNWTILSSGIIKSQVYALAMPASNAWYACTGRNQIWKSTDAGLTWIQQTNPLTGTSALNDIVFADANTGYAVGNSGGIVKTTDGGITWTSLTSPHGTTAIYSMHMFDAQKLITVGGTSKAYLTTNGGANWSPITVGLPGNYFAVKFLNNNLGYVTSYSSPSGTVAKTTDGGVTWTAQTLPSNATISIWGIAIKDNNIAWLADANGNIFYTYNGGTTWNSAKKNCGNGFFSMAIAGTKLFAAGSGGTILQGWADPNVPVEFNSFSCNVVGTTVILNWQTGSEKNNKGFEIERKYENSNWMRIGFVEGKGTSTNINEYSYMDEFVSTGKIQYRIKQIDFDGSFEYSNSVEVSIGLPSKFELFQNYPNPFNPITRIAYSVAKKQLVTLKVYDILGNEIATLVNNIQDIGNYSVQFNVNNSLSSNIYFYELHSGDFVQVRKMLLIK
jgi:photosystem II stability/assembly factor-like uncharacterized protein